MSRLSQLAREDALELASPARVVSLDQSVEAPVAFGNGYLRSLQLTNQLSRFLDVGQIVETFVQEVSGELACCGYIFHAADLGNPIDWGLTQGFHCSFQLKLQNRWLGELTLCKVDRFTAVEQARLAEWLPAIIFPLKNAIMYQVLYFTLFYKSPAISGLNRSPVNALGR